MQYEHCDKCVFGGKTFKAGLARIHLAATSSNGLCSKLCSATDDSAVERQLFFQRLLQTLTEKRKNRRRKRKQQQARLDSREKEASAAGKRRKKKQYNLNTMLKTNDNMAADLAVAQWAIAHDIPHACMEGPY